MMEKKFYRPRHATHRSWYRLLSSALILASLLLFIPLMKGPALQVPLPRLPEPMVAALSLPPVWEGPQSVTWQPEFGLGQVQATGGLTITKIADPTSVDQGGLITYTLIISNDTGGALNNVVVSDVIPLNTDCNAIGNVGGWQSSFLVCQQGLAFWIQSGATLNNNAGVTFVYTVAVRKPLTYPTIITNDSYEVVGTSVSTGGTISDPGTIPITTAVNSPSWGISKTVVPDTTVKAGERLTYTITITNVGSLATDGSFYTLADDIPDNTTLIDNPDSASFDGVTLTWFRSAVLAPGTPAEFAFSVRVNDDVPEGRITNTTYSISDGGAFSSVSGAPVSVPVNARPDLIISKTDLADELPLPVRAGSLLTYTITYANGGGVTLAGARITDTLPTSVTLETILPGNATLLGSDPPVFSLPSLAPADTGVITLVTRLLTTTPWPATFAGQNFTNTVIASVANNEVDPNNNADTVVTAGRPDIPVAASLEIPAQLPLGDTLPITVTVRDQYGNPAWDGDNISVNFEIEAPGSVTPLFVNNTSNGLALATIRSDITGTLDVTATINLPIPITLSKVTTVTLARLSKVVTPKLVRAGDMVTYTIRYFNDGTSSISNLYLTDTLPSQIHTLAAPITGTMTVVDGILPSLVFAQTNLDVAQTAIMTVVGRVITAPWPATPVNLANQISATHDSSLATETETVISQGGSNLAQTITLQVAPTTTLVGGQAVIRATVRDPYLNPVLDGTSVSFATSLAGSTISPIGLTQNGLATATVTANTGGSTTITATVNSQLATGAVTFARPTLTVSKVGSPEPVRAGDKLVYTVLVENTSLVVAPGVVVTDTLDSNLTFDEANVTENPAGRDYGFALGMLLPGETKTLLITTTVNTGLSDNTLITNTVVVTAPDLLASPSATDITTVMNEAQNEKIYVPLILK